MAIDRRLRRGKFARELGNPDGLSRSCESFQQAQRQIDGLGCRTLVRESPLSRRLSESYDFGHDVSHNETMFHYPTKPCSGCQRLGTMLRKALTRCRPGLRVQKSPLLAQSGPKRDRLCLSAFGAKRTSAAALSRSSQPLLTRSGYGPGQNSAVQRPPAAVSCAILSVGSAGDIGQ